MEPKIEVVRIDPEMAAELLRDHNDRNRPIDWTVVRTYARQMTDGKWTFVGDPIRRSVTGRLLDGQYRLSAVVQSGTTQEFVLVSGLPDDSQTFMDIGKKRTPSDVFAMHQVPNAPRAAAVTNLVMRYELRNMLDTKYVITIDELLSYYRDEANTNLIDRGTSMGDSVKRILPMSPAVVGAVHVIVSRESDPFTVAEFFEKLIKGYGLEEGDSIAALRNWVIRRKREDLRVNRYEYFYLLARTWNDWVRDVPAYRVQLPKGGLTSSEQIPQLVVAGPRDAEPISEDNPLATPRSLTRREREIRARAEKSA